jgi:hypothetical protein
MSIAKRLFTVDNLNANYELEWPHGYNTEDVIAKWYDENGIERGTSDLFQVIDANNIILRCGEAITGLHKIMLYYETAGQATSGRRMFELATTTNPTETLRIALGKAATPASNITLTAFLAWLMTKLGFLKVANNLSDLNNKITARANLGVYSTSQVDTELAKKAALYQAGTGAVLGIANTSIYNPSSNYNPAVLRNVKNSGMRLLLAGGVSSAGLWQATKFLNTDVLDLSAISSARQSTGVYRIAHNYGDATQYMVMAATLGTHSAHITCIDKQANYFDLRVWDDDSLDDQDFEFVMIDFFTFTADE